MQNTISGHQVDTGDALREHVESHLTAMNERLNARVVSTKTIFSRNSTGGFRCTVSVHPPRQHFVSEGDGLTTQSAFDQALSRVKKQVRRHVRSLKHFKNERIDISDES